uniref:Beta'-coat protein n=1 Tax=Albugo laibachii Nc14 TaxID=890382 RepID=F0WAB4_9STRA|nr:hypothetical protein ARALYDRAFT_895999 [Albugo laibachii Nc14]|eukprot:CCA18084.1 hypothetical protein ARALYDRAFT_895999 [Albugo laibachii Nc14]
MIWNYDTQTLVKSIEVSSLPVRDAKFVVRKQWILTSSDDMMIRVFNYNTIEKITSFEAHTDYIRHLEVHPSLPCVLSCADDMSIKMWDWEKGWSCTQVFDGHGHYVMMVKFNPKDTNTFASASLDRTVRVWGLGSSHAHFALDGHERGVNCVDYYPGGDKPYLLSGSDDRTVKIWDYQTKAILHTFDGHGNNLTAVLFHPRLPLIISACEDGAVRMWHATTYRAETTLNYGMERAWSLAALKSANKVAIGYDEGTMVVRLGHDTPIASMDQSGKIIWAINHEVQTASVKSIVSEMGLQDGEKLPLPARELGSCEVYPQKIRHNSNGRFVSVCGDSEYIIYTSQQLRNKAYGYGLDFAWSPLGTGDYVVRESINKITLFRNFKEYKSDKPRVCSAEGLFGGVGAIGIKGNECVAMYDWEEMRLIRKIDVMVKNVYWSESGNLVVLACEKHFFVLAYNKDLVTEAFANGTNHPEDGVDGSFELLHEISEKICTGVWVGDCFLYTNSTKRLNYYVGGEVMSLAHLEQKSYILGYLPRENLIFLMDKMKNVYSFTVSLVMLEYQTAVVRKDFESANSILPNIPQDQMDLVARFLESQGYKEEALALSTDPDQKFDLAVQLAKLDVAREIMLNEIESVQYQKPQQAGSTAELSIEMQHKWKQLGDLALNDFQFDLAEECALRADDFSLLLILYTSRGDGAGLEKVARLATDKRRFNVAFLCRLLLNQTSECVEVLKETERVPEAAFFARSYCPSKLGLVMNQWREDLASVSIRAAKALADPTQNSELFENLDFALQAEKEIAARSVINKSAQDYEEWQTLLDSQTALETILSGSFHGNLDGQKSLPPSESKRLVNSGHDILRGDEAVDVAVPSNSATDKFCFTDSSEASVRNHGTSGDAHARVEQNFQEYAEAEAKAKAEQAAQEHAEFEARASAEQEAVERAEFEARASAEHEARERAEYEARAKAEHEAREHAEYEARAKAEHEAREHAEYEIRARAEQEARVRAEAKAIAKAEQEARERAEFEVRARVEQEARELAEFEARTRAEQEARVRAEAEAKAKAEQEAQERAEFEARASVEQEARERAEFEARARVEQEARVRAEAEAKAKAEQEARECAELTRAFEQSPSNLLDYESGVSELQFEDDDDWGEM